MLAGDELGLENGSHNPCVSVMEEEATSTAVKRKKQARQPRKHVSRHFKISKPKAKGRSQLQAREKLGLTSHDQVHLPDGLGGGPTSGSQELGVKGLRPKRKRRQARKNASRHFRALATERQACSPSQRQEKSMRQTPPPAPRQAKQERRARVGLPQADVQPLANILMHPRIINGVDIDEEFSSDSSLTSVPSDIGPDPFLPPSPLPPKVLGIKAKRCPLHPTKSPYFPNAHRHKSRPTFISSILPFPPLSSPTFGLMQERLAHDPFRLLIATIFLNKTPGARAMPVFYDLMARYPTPDDLAAARVEDVVEIIRCLGFQNQRARKCVALAQSWASGGEPVLGKRYAKRDYPRKGDGRGIGTGDWVPEGDERVAWEIGHLPGVGAYAHDSWRMFCRDVLRGLARGWNGEGADAISRKTTAEDTPEQHEEAERHVHGKAAHLAAQPDPRQPEREQEEVPFEPEWKRVLPSDKELRAWMTWMWLKEGWVWNYRTGECVRASDELLSKATGGGVLREELQKDELVVEGLDEEARDGLDKQELQNRVDRPAGIFISKLLVDGNQNEGGRDIGEYLDSSLDEAVRLEAEVGK